MNDTLDLHPAEAAALGAVIDGLSSGLKEASNYLLPDYMVEQAASEACDFFGLPELPVVTDADFVGVFRNDPTTVTDDIFVFNRNQLMDMGITGQASLTLVYAHECAHTALQGLSLGAWEEELACDMFSGVMAGCKGYDISNVTDALGATSGSESHPHGALRADIIEFGRQMAEEMNMRGIPITYEACMDRFNDCLMEKGDIINEYRMRSGA